MQAQLAWWKAVKSYERKCSVMRSSVCGHEPSVHEPHVTVKVIRSSVARCQVCTCPSHVQVGLSDDATEIGNDRWVMASIVVDALYWSRKKEVNGCAKWSSDCVGDRFWLHRTYLQSVVGEQCLRYRR